MTDRDELFEALQKLDLYYQARHEQRMREMRRHTLLSVTAWSICCVILFAAALLNYLASTRTP